jgi:tetrahydromethanopterin S-methyltransferase subunit G
VGIDNNDKYYAIQSKFRKRNKYRKTTVSWKELSTFYALCERTGPYDKYIVFTTADYVNRIGKKTEKDITIGYNKLLKLIHFDWLKLCNHPLVVHVDHPLPVTPPPVKANVNNLTVDELRERRLLFYDTTIK